MNESQTYYHFLSSSRQGLAAAINADTKQKRAEVEMQLHVAKRSQDSGKWDKDISIVKRSVQLYGPGDIVGFNENMVVRTDPKPDSGNFEPNYFPIIELADVDFVWRYTAKSADDKGLSPWLVLVVLVAEDRGDDNQREFDPLPRGTNQIPKIKVHRQSDLPDLDKAWRWAHVQVSSDKEDISEEELIDIIKNNPHRAVSRLMCPRRLQPKTLYNAFLVPAYKLGWAAGLDTPVARDQTGDSDALEPTWDHSLNESIDLPYYYRWEFRTSVRGDFEHLVRLLKPQVLTGLGLREIDCEHPGFGLSVERQTTIEDSKKTHVLDMEGALKSLDTQYTDWGRDRPGFEETDSQTSSQIAEPKPEPFQQRLADELLNRANTDITAIADKPVVEHSAEFNTSQAISEIEYKLLNDGMSVTILWKTENSTTGRVEYAQHLNDNIIYDSMASSDNLSTTHSVTIILLPETTYHFQLVINENGNELSTGDATLRVPLPTMVPPIYGRWHAARKKVMPGDDYWLEELNLDPRHRAGAGLGAEVLRKQQEALMASAWDQIGAIEAANDILRRAQVGREGSIFLHDRFSKMALEDFLRISAPVQKRITRGHIIGDPHTLSSEFETSTNIPHAALAPAFRHITRARGAIRKRQQSRPMDMLCRLASGELIPAGQHPAPEGTPGPCEVTKELASSNLAPFISLGADVVQEVDGRHCTLEIFLTWHSKNATQLVASGDEDWSGVKNLNGKTVPGIVKDWLLPITAVDVGEAPVSVLDGIENVSIPTGSLNDSDAGSDVQEPNQRDWTFKLTAVGKNCNSTATVKVVATDPGSSDDLITISIASESTQPIVATSLNFCEKNISCERINESIADALQGVSDSTEQSELAEAVCDGLNHFSPSSEETDENSPNMYEVMRYLRHIAKLRIDITHALNPRKTIQDRTKCRLRLKGDLAKRFDEDAPGDPLDEIMAYPEFPQPMYEPLKELSETHILPGVEKVRQNTIGVLKTNRRFMEAYMLGLNHEMSSELLWRRYPTDQRGTYFRQFWDVSEYVGKYHQNPEISELTANGELKKSIREKLKDIPHVHGWDEARLGANSNDNKYRNTTNSSSEDDKEFLVLIIRGDLLKRYPNAVIYAVDARKVENSDGSEKYVPKLAEFDEPVKLQKLEKFSISTKLTSMAEKITFFKPLGLTTSLGMGNQLTRSPPQYPIFRGSLGADLVFLGFPFYASQVKSSDSNPGKFFVFEERISEARFGLDVASQNKTASGQSRDMSNLNWGDFKLDNVTTLTDAFGHFLDDCDIHPDYTVWNNDDSAALRANMTLQKPARLIVHADQMIPD